MIRRHSSTSRRASRTLEVAHYKERRGAALKSRYRVTFGSGRPPYLELIMGRQSTFVSIAHIYICYCSEVHIIVLPPYNYYIRSLPPCFSCVKCHVRVVRGL